MHPNVSFRPSANDDPLGEIAAIAFAAIFAATPHGPRVGEDWTRAKMDAPRFEAMLGAITAFEMTATATRTTHKLSQNKRADVAERLIGAMTAKGDAATADAMRRARR